MGEGVELLNAIQDVYLDQAITVAYAGYGCSRRPIRFAATRRPIAPMSAR